MRVMRETGQSLRDVAHAPYHTTLWVWAHAAGRDRRESLVRQGDRIDLASAIAIAFHEPKRLRELVQSHRAAIGLLPSHEDAVKKGTALIEELEAVARRVAAADAGAASDTVVSGADVCIEPAGSGVVPS